jgi:hypothetical protein
MPNRARLPGSSIRKIRWNCAPHSLAGLMGFSDVDPFIMGITESADRALLCP